MLRSSELGTGENAMQLKQVKERLKDWGRFWRSKREGSGYGSNSVTGRLCETLRTGVFSQGTKYQVMHTADEIHVPDHIAEIDDCLKYLTPSELVYLKLFYINNKGNRTIFIDRAENKIAGLL